MRVISKFHDYYDIGLSYGIDPKCVYVRETREIAFESLTGDNPAWLRDAMADEAFGKDIVGQLQHRRWDEDEWVDEVLVLFCGKAYLGIAYAGAYRWSWEALREAILAGPDTPLRRALETGKPQRSGRGWWFLPRYRELELSYAAADALNGRRPFLDAIHVGAGTPALAFRPDRKTGGRFNRFGAAVTLDPELKSLGFATVVDPYTAFQEISMYLTNVIGIPENPTVDVDDASKIAKHGYDERSFRHPTSL